VRTWTAQLPSGHRLHVTEHGAGTPVVMCHGFPGLGYSYRHQLRPVAAAGFRAVAPDMLGYGGSSAPADPVEYTHEHVTADLLALLDAMDAPRAVFVGHDFGAPAAWNVAQRAPERVAGLVLLSVPYDPLRLPVRPSQVYASAAREHFLHTHYFQAPGVAEAELGARPAEFLARLFHALSSAYRYIDVWQHPSDGNGYLDVLPDAPPLPWAWLSADEFDRYVRTFTRTGFGGGLNWYRALDANWQLDARFAGAALEVPTLFVAGVREPVLDVLGAAALERMRAAVPDLRGVQLLDGAGHWVQQERADAVNGLLVDFLAQLT
jgi:pimeloyl-ACP methyl ester carboxylesterase